MIVRDPLARPADRSDQYTFGTFIDALLIPIKR